MSGSFHELVSNQPALSFGRFRLLPFQKLLIDGDQTVRLGGRAFDILAALVERAGEVLSKGELMAVAWPDTFVEESSLRVHIAALRRILGHGDETSRFIVNVSGRGYCFTAPVQRLNWDSSFSASLRPAEEPRELPALATRLIGRDQAIATIADQLRARRITTITGSGGIGKTTVALAATERIARELRDGAIFVDLASLEDHKGVPMAVAAALGLTLTGNDPLASLTRHLRGKQVLLVLDNCEHLLEPTAAIVEAILANLDEVLILATSREPLRAGGEWIYRLAPLGFPGDDETCTPANATSFPAIELFVERASAAADSFELDERSAEMVGRICHDLDGVPLAIEIAAAQVSTFSLEELCRLLEQEAILDARGTRTARSRHQSLSALLDWSYNLLAEDERTVLRRLSALRGRFTQDAALAVASGGAIDRSRTLGLVGELAAKSMLTADVSGEQVHYRLAVTTRTYAATKLAETNEERDVLRRHAIFCRDTLATAQVQWGKITVDEWMRRYSPMLDDARAGIDWAFGQSGDLRVGLELTAGFTTLGFRLWLIDELQERVALALRVYPFDTDPAPTIEARLCIAVAGLIAMISGASQAVAANYARALDIASRLGVSAMQVEALAGSFAWAYGLADYHASESYAQQIALIAGGLNDPAVQFIADRCLAQARSGVGDHARAIVLAERVLNSPVKTVPSSYMLFPIDVAVSMRIVQARGSWIMGKADRAVDLAQAAIEASFSDAAYAPCQAWGLAAIPIALWRGELDRAAEMTEQMRKHSQRLGLTWWERWTEHFSEVIRLKSLGDERVISAGVSANAGPMVDEFLGAVDHRYVGPDLLLRIDNNHAGWCAPEVLRSRAVQLLRLGGDEEEAQVLLDRSLALSRRQGALAWELRTATTISERLMMRGDRPSAETLLRPLLAQFTEGNATADLVAARSLLRY